MWLSRLLCGARSTPGKQWIGKHRKVWKMTATRRKNTRDREKEIQQVEMMLSQPYLSQAEEQRHAMQRRRDSSYVPLFIRQRRNKWMKRERATFTALERSN